MQPKKSSAEVATSQDKVLQVVYFSSASQNTHRFVQKLNVHAERIPLHTNQAKQFQVFSPYILICPTYGGKKADGRESGYVPVQVISFLNNKANRDLMQGVIAAGNSNFGADYGNAGKIIAEKCDVPYLYRFELMGTSDDVEQVRIGITTFSHHALAG